MVREEKAMSRLFVSGSDDNGTLKWGIFYKDSKGEIKAHCEDFEPLSFDSEEEAASKLESIEKERAREDSALPFDLSEARKFAEDHKWKFAVTYAETAPHEYLVKKWLSEEDKILFEKFVANIKRDSVTGYFYGHKNSYLTLGDYYYWIMPGHENQAADLINRTTCDYLEERDGVYYYKGPDTGRKDKGGPGYKVVDKKDFKRADMYHRFTEECKCSVSMTARVDVTELVEYSRSSKTRFYLNFLYILCKVLNSSDDYKMGYIWQDDLLIVHDVVNPIQYVWREDLGTCTRCYSEYCEDYDAFYHKAQEDMERAKDPDYKPSEGDHPNWFEASCVPWVSYDALHVELPDGYLFFAPIINWGRYREEEGRLMMPVTVRLNHATADGFTVANVFRLLEREMGLFCEKDL